MITVEIELHDDDGEVWHRMPLPAEPTDVDGLAITPMVGAPPEQEPRYLGGWAVTHIASGYNAGAGLCLPCARTLAGRLGLLSVNWSRAPLPHDDPRMKEAAQLAIAALVDCDAHESGEEGHA